MLGTLSIHEILEELQKIKELETKLKKKKEELESMLFSQIPKGKPLYLGNAKITWTRSAKVSNNKFAKIFASQYPQLAERIFSISYRPKISEIDKIEVAREINEVPNWYDEEAWNELIQNLKVEERPRIVWEDDKDE